MALRHFSHELRRVARESALPALVPTGVVLFCVGVWHFLWVVRAVDPAQVAKTNASHRLILSFFDTWWPCVGWVFPYLIVKRLDPEDRAGLQRTLPLTRGELLGAKLVFTGLATVLLPTAAFATYQAWIHPENVLVQTGNVAATQWLLACGGATAALLAPGWRGIAWVAGAGVIGLYLVDATGRIVAALSGPDPVPVFAGTAGAAIAAGCAFMISYGALLLAPLVVAGLVAARRRPRAATWLMLAVPAGVLTGLAQSAARAPRFARAETAEPVTVVPLSAAEAKTVAKAPWFKRFAHLLVPVARANVTLHAPGLVPGSLRCGQWDAVTSLPGIAGTGPRADAAYVAARIVSTADTESFGIRKHRFSIESIDQTDHHDRIARIIATGLFPREVHFWRLGPTPKDHGWHPVAPSPDTIRLELTLTAAAGAGAGAIPESTTVAVPFIRYAAPEILFRTPAAARAILRERDRVVTIPPVFNSNPHNKQREGELRTDIGIVQRAGPFRRFGHDCFDPYPEVTPAIYAFVVFNRVKNQAVIIPSPALHPDMSLLSTPAESQLNSESPQVDEDWLKESELLVIRLRALEPVTRLLKLRPAAADQN